MSPRLQYAIVSSIVLPLTIGTIGLILFGLNYLFQYLTNTGHDFLAFCEIIVIAMITIGGLSYLFYNPDYQRYPPYPTLSKKDENQL